MRHLLQTECDAGKKKRDFHGWAKVRGTIFHEVAYAGLHTFKDVYWGVIAEHEKEAPIRCAKGKMEDDYDGLYEECKGYFDWLAESKIEVVQREFKFTWSIERTSKEIKQTTPSGLYTQGQRYDFEGTADLLAVMPDTPEDEVELIDFKTGQMQSPKALSRNLQLGNYVYGLATNGIKVNRCFWGRTKDLLRYKRDGKGGKKGDFRGKFLHPIIITEDDFSMIKAMNLQICRAIKINVRYMNTRECDSCEYTSHCPAYKVGAYDDSFERALDYMEGE
jgi:hypothetical protein